MRMASGTLRGRCIAMVMSIKNMKIQLSGSSRSCLGQRSSYQVEFLDQARPTGNDKPPGFG